MADRGGPSAGGGGDDPAGLGGLEGGPEAPLGRAPSGPGLRRLHPAAAGRPGVPAHPDRGGAAHHRRLRIGRPRHAEPGSRSGRGRVTPEGSLWTSWLDPRVEAYLQSLNRTADPVLEEMEELAREGDFPIVGAHAGKLLSILTRATGARRVLELGLGLRLFGLVVRPQPASRRAGDLHGFLGRQPGAGPGLPGQGAGFADKSEFLVGDELQAVRALAAQPLSGGFDIVFNDVDERSHNTQFEEPEAAVAAILQIFQQVREMGTR